MSFHPLLIGGDPFAVTSAYSLIAPLERRYGVHSAMGGTGALVRGLVSLLEGAGGELRCNSEVAADRHRPGPRHRASPWNGRASGGRPGRLERRLGLDLPAPGGARHRRHWTDRKIDSGRYSMGLFVWYFGTRKRYEDVPHHMMVLGPRYKELLQDIFRHKKLATTSACTCTGRRPPTPRWPHPGCDTFYVLVPVPHLDSGTDWAATPSPTGRPSAPPRATACCRARRRVVSSKVTTPLDFQDRLLSFKGAAFGLEPLLLQSAWFRPHNRSEDVQGLYIVGASTHPGPVCRAC
jgi:phytoene desaturase